MKDNERAADLLLNADSKVISKAMDVSVSRVQQVDLTEKVYEEFEVLPHYMDSEIDQMFVDQSNERQNLVRYNMKLINGGKTDDQ